MFVEFFRIDLKVAEINYLDKIGFITEAHLELIFAVRDKGSDGIQSYVTGLIRNCFNYLIAKFLSITFTIGES